MGIKNEITSFGDRELVAFVLLRFRFSPIDVAMRGHPFIICIFSIIRLVWVDCYSNLPTFIWFACCINSFGKHGRYYLGSKFRKQVHGEACDVQLCCYLFRGVCCFSVGRGSASVINKLFVKFDCCILKASTYNSRLQYLENWSDLKFNESVTVWWI